MSDTATEKKPRSARVWHKLILIISYCAILCLCWYPRSDLILDLLRDMLAGAAVIALLPPRVTDLSERPRLNWWQALTGALFCLRFSTSFFGNLIAHRHLTSLIARLGGRWTAIVLAVDLFGLLCSLPLVWKVLQLARSLQEKVERAAREHREYYGLVPMRWMKYILIGVVFFFEFNMLQYSLITFPDTFLFMNPKYLGLSYGLLIVFHVVLVAVLQRWRYAALVGDVFFILWSVANYYVYLLHGSPLYFSELANTRTAMDVVSNYSISIFQVPWEVLGLAVLSLAAVHTLWVVDREYRTVGWRYVMARVVIVAALIAPIYNLLIYKNAPKIIHALPTYYASTYGFGCMAVYEVARSINPIIVPEGYTPESLPQAVVTSADNDRQMPDIIFIINESFCDLGDYTDLAPDRDYLAPFYGIEGAFYGHSHSPVIGGGTNNSEYECLTGLPYYLVTAAAPFNYLNFNNITCNAAQYFHRLGYVSEGMHYYSRVNYHRSTAYPAMGFDKVILGPPEGLDLTMNGSREHLDASYYTYLESEYETLSDDAPRFMYLLTFQNHGGYRKNSPELDTVHTGVNFGTVTEEVNEYLSSMALSAEAFKGLTEYFSRVDRPVIICMVGDHAPSIINSMESSVQRSSRETEMAKRAVPYVMWSNYGLDLSGCREDVAMYTLLPQLISVSGLPLTQFYQTELTMSDEFPCLFKNGLVLASDGSVDRYDVSEERFDPITRYLYMSYNALKNGSDYVEEFFLPR